jgi:hypothetical protein
MENNNEPEQIPENHAHELIAQILNNAIDEKTIEQEETPFEEHELIAQEETHDHEFDNHVPELEETPIEEKPIEEKPIEEKPIDEKTIEEKAQKMVKENPVEIPESILAAKPKSKNSDFENIIWLIVILIVIVLIYYITTYFTNGKKNYTSPTTQPGHDTGNGSEYTSN